jgi:hypothetical protein
MNKGPGRPNLGKTETIRQRAVVVYVPTSNMFEEWKAEAAMHGVSVSRFVYELVDNTIRKRDSSFTPREELEKQVMDLQEEAKRLSERLVQAEAFVNEDKETIAKYREKLSAAMPATLDPRFTKKIASLFLKREVVPLNEIPGLIGIRLDDKKGMARIVDSMNFLVACDFIEENMNEGRWIAERGSKYRSSGKVRGHD